MTTLDKTNTLYYFEHQAMATQFTIGIVHENEYEAANIANRCFMRIDELELKLSRFVPDSDISRINKMENGDHVILDRETYECIKIGIEVSEITKGVFDIGLAQLTDIFRAFKKGLLNMPEYKTALKQVFEEKQEGSIFLDPEDPIIYCIKEGIKIDLGGIGKGYALDEIASMLNEMEVYNYSLNAGQSTILVKNNPDQKPFWKYTIASLKEEKIVQLKNTAVSASGFYWNDKHIFHPHTGSNDLYPEFERIWTCCDSAAYADAFSTAFFLMEAVEIEKVCKKRREINWVNYSKEGVIKVIA